VGSNRDWVYVYFALFLKIRSIFSLNSDGLIIFKVSSMKQLFLDVGGLYTWNVINYISLRRERIALRPGCTQPWLISVIDVTPWATDILFPPVF
jgi:hypothetical protein